MENILRLRARRFQALYALLTGDVGPDVAKTGTFPDHLSRDLGLPEQTQHARPVTQIGTIIHPGGF